MEPAINTIIISSRAHPGRDVTRHLMTSTYNHPTDSCQRHPQHHQRRTGIKELECDDPQRQVKCSILADGRSLATAATAVRCSPAVCGTPNRGQRGSAGLGQDAGSTRESGYHSGDSDAGFVHGDVRNVVRTPGRSNPPIKGGDIITSGSHHYVPDRLQCSLSRTSIGRPMSSGSLLLMQAESAMDKYLSAERRGNTNEALACINRAIYFYEQVLSGDPTSPSTEDQVRLRIKYNTATLRLRRLQQQQQQHNPACIAPNNQQQVTARTINPRETGNRRQRIIVDTADDRKHVVVSSRPEIETRGQRVPDYRQVEAYATLPKKHSERNKSTHSTDHVTTSSSRDPAGRSCSRRSQDMAQDVATGSMSINRISTTDQCGLFNSMPRRRPSVAQNNMATVQQRCNNSLPVVETTIPPRRNNVIWC